MGRHPGRGRIRLPWILANGVGLFLSGKLLVYFQGGLKESLYLLAFVPMIMGIGGNIGSQTSTIAVRSLAGGRLRQGQGMFRPFVWHQVRVGALLGGICASLAAVVAFFQVEANPYYALVVGAALFLVIVLASFSGALAPIIFERLGIDPAVAAGPLVTTATDLAGVFIYFGFAFLLFEWLVS